MEKEECLLTEKKFRNKLIQHRILPGLQRRHNINTHQPKTEKKKGYPSNPFCGNQIKTKLKEL